MIKKISEAELTKMCVELLSKTYLDLGQHNIDAKTYYKWIKLWRNIIWNNEGVADHQKDKRLAYRSETKLITNK